MQKLIRVWAIFAALWSLFPWGIAAALCLLGALLPDPGSIISFKFPWWAVGLVWAVEPVFLVLLWRAQKSKGALIFLSAGIGICMVGSLRSPLFDLLWIWLGPTLLLLPLLFWRHRRMA